MTDIEAGRDPLCTICGEPIEEYPDAFSGGWTHVDVDHELKADHAATPVSA